MTESKRSPLWFALLATLILALALWRSSLGLTYLDDATYGAVPLRLAQGSLPLADEMNLQALGYLPAVPFAWLWSALFGTDGILMALRAFHVLLAAAVGFIAFRLVRASVGSIPAGMVVLPLLAPPYSILATSYNTSVQMSSLLMLAFSMAALRTEEARYAVASGVSGALTVLFYPPLAPAVLAAGIAFAVVSRGKRALAVAAVAGGLVVAAVVVLWIALVPGFQAVTGVLQAGFSERPTAWAIAKTVRQARELASALAYPTLWPLWGLSLLAVVLRGRARSACVALMPLAAAIPALARALHVGSPPSWGAHAAAWLTTLAIAAAAPVVLAVGKHEVVLRKTLLIAAWYGLVGALAVGYSTASSITWGAIVVGVTPFAALTVIATVRIVDGQSRRLARLAAVTSISIALLLLFSVAFKQPPPLTLSTRVSAGAAAGLGTTESDAEKIDEERRGLGTYIRPGDRVFVLGAPLGYLLSPGRMHTNSVWLTVREPNIATIRYFGEAGRPDVVLLSRPALGEDPADRPDTPLLGWLERHYDRVGSAGRFDIYILSQSR